MLTSLTSILSSHLNASLTSSPTHPPATLQHLEDTAVYILNEVYKDKSTTGRALVKVFLKLDKVVFQGSDHMTVTHGHMMSQYVNHLCSCPL